MPVPSGALAHLDFVNALYFDGATVTASDVIDHPEWITANGLEIRFANETDPGTGLASVIGDALTPLLTWCTIILDWDTEGVVDPDPGGLIMLQMQSDGPDYDDVLTLQTLSNCFDYSDTSGPRNLFPTPDGSSSGRHRIALTQTTDSLSASIDGGAVYTVGLSLTDYTPTTATIGGGDWSNFFISGEFNLRSLTVYAPRPDEDLPGLSSLEEPEPEPETAPQSGGPGWRPPFRWPKSPTAEDVNEERARLGITAKEEMAEHVEHLGRIEKAAHMIDARLLEDSTVEEIEEEIEASEELEELLNSFSADSEARESLRDLLSRSIADLILRMR